MDVRGGGEMGSFFADTTIGLNTKYVYLLIVSHVTNHTFINIIVEKISK